MKVINIITAISLLAGFSVATTAFAIAGKDNTEERVVSEIEAYDENNELIPHGAVSYEVNEYGETYGSIAGVPYFSDYPDLIAVVGNDGLEGYARKDEWVVPERPSCPEEAIRMQEEREKNPKPDIIINVYEIDGRTVIDTLNMHQ